MTIHFSSPPPEWAPQDDILIGWPSHTSPWGSREVLEAARIEIAAYANAILEAGKRFDGPKTGVKLLLEGTEAEAAAREAVPGAGILNLPCGDTWLRDTGPILSWQGDRLKARSFGFNGWGGKYIYPGDEDLSVRLAPRLSADLIELDFILEGGSVDWDGEGYLLTTDECLINPNRNAGWTRTDAEATLKQALGASDVIWVRQGLVNDHTDGHIDNLARFVAPGHVVCQAPAEDDPHADRLEGVYHDLASFRSADGRGLKITEIPSPGRVLDEDGEVMPASHMNFVITNQAVIIPGYNERAELAVSKLQTLFPGRRVLSVPAYHVLSEGGAFHCISQQVPTRP
tara:strand:- start:5185 stop:6213 length:1029 start_codon:yes stop_codon:yes gene_type:complete